jgi:putative two-component system response regulator
VQRGEYPAVLTPTYIDLLTQSAPLHDIGKVAIPDAILFKPGALTPEEFAVIKRHTTIGGEVIRRAESFLGTNSFLRTAGEIAEYHHERWDGSGYPHGLKGEAIPFSAQLMAVADVYDALVSERPYKPPYSHEQAFGIITGGDGRACPEHFSPVVLEAFRQVQREWKLIKEEIRD